MLTRKQFDAAIRRLSYHNPDPPQAGYHCRVEICVQGQWRVMTDQCRQESNIPRVLKALGDLLFIYVQEYHAEATPADCKKLGPPQQDRLDAGMKMW